jgi:hypothetical protein
LFVFQTRLDRKLKDKDTYAARSRQGGKEQSPHRTQGHKEAQAALYINDTDKSVKSTAHSANSIITRAQLTNDHKQHITT